ncbi:MAG: EAL domain-containing protein [Pseudomonadota bacterium]|nr:EAL domain-containing protein [Pseudomonadota bacterium]
MQSRRFSRLIRDPFLALILLTSGIIATEATVNLVLVQRYQHDLIEVSSYDVAFDFNRAQIELMRLRDVLVDDSFGDSRIRSEIAIIKTRLTTLPTEIGSDDFAPAKAAKAKLQTGLAAIEAATLSPNPQDRAEAAALAEHLASSFGRAATIANVKQGDVVEEQRQRLTRSLAHIELLTYALGVLGLIMMVFLLKYRRRLTRRAATDALTGLPNRTALKELIETGLSDEAIAVAMIDVDRFKEINDNHGHSAGDAVLRLIANCMRRVLGPQEYAIRIGGDEFALIALGKDADRRVLERCQAIETLFRDRCLYHPDRATASLSIGIASAKSQSERQIDELLVDADVAMYSAKSEGRAQIAFATEEFLKDAAMQKRLQRDLAYAIEDEQLHVAFQPIIDLSTGSIAYFESLLRWTHPQFGPIRPDNFIALAEASGDIIPIGRFVLREALANLRHWPESIGVTVNVSALQLGDDMLVSQVGQLLETHEIDPARLTLEITESVLVRNVHSEKIVNEFQAMGVAVALDDFGTGYASMGYLRDHTFEKIKIDKSFVSAMTKPGNSRAIVRAICNLGRDLGALIVAEGIESEADLATTRAAGCTHGQGYLFAKPMPSADVVTFIRTWQRETHAERRAAHAAPKVPATKRKVA